MRINEDYLENCNYSPEDVNDILERMLDDEFCNIIDLIVDGTYEGERPDFEYARDAIYPVDNRKLHTVIWALRKLYGFKEHMNLNWLDVSSVTQMTELFYKSVPSYDKTPCNVDVSRWDVRNVISTSKMFGWTTFNGNVSSWKLESLDVCEHMFAYSSFDGDLSSWDISSVFDPWNMLDGCPIYNKPSKWPKGYKEGKRKKSMWDINEDYLDIDRHHIWDAGSVLDHQIRVDEFCDIIDLIVADEYDGERPDFENARDAIYPVDSRELRTVIRTLRKLYGFEEHMNLNWLDVSQVTYMNTLFYQEFLPGNTKAHCNVDVSRWDVSNVISTSYMFSYSDFNGNVSKWNLKSLEDCSYMFAYSLFNGDLSGWDISGASDKRHMLDGCPIHRRMDCLPKGYHWD